MRAAVCGSGGPAATLLRQAAQRGIMPEYVGRSQQVAEALVVAVHKVSTAVASTA